MTVSLEQIKSAVNARRDWAVESLSELVRQPTVLGNEGPGQKVMARLYENLGMEVHVEPLEVERIKDKPGFSPTSWKLDGKENVIGVMRARDPQGRSLIFNGHIDVVSPEPTKLWTSPPYEPRVTEEDGETWMYGRGAGDMKGGTMCYLWALHALRDLGFAPASDVICQSPVEEECTGNGALAILENGWRADAAIIPEPFNETVLVSQVGVLWFQVRVLGRTTHVLGAGRGVNAIERSWPIIQALRQMEEEVNQPGNIPELYADVEHPINLNVGTINGGDWQSTVAGECVTGFRFGAFPGQKLEPIKQRIEDTVRKAAEADPWLKDNLPTVEWIGFQAEGCVFDVNSDFGQTLVNAHKQWRDREPEQLKCTATTDVRFFNLYYDIPATCYGPVAENIHGVDERVSIDSMQRVTEVMCSVIQDWCKLRQS
jgi:acetylornithine deacetylase